MAMMAIHVGKEEWLDVFYSGAVWATSREASWDWWKYTISTYF